jgi:hypothetical protein
MVKIAWRTSQQAAKYQLGDAIYPKGVTPECFYRGSSSEPACGEPRRTTAKSMRE